MKTRLQVGLQCHPAYRFIVVSEVKSLPYSVGIIFHCPNPHDPSHPSKTILPTFLSTLTRSGISHTKIFVETVTSMTALPFTALKLSRCVDGILIFSIQLLDPCNPKDVTSPLLDALQQISLRQNYPAIVPGFVSCLNTPESVLEMKGILKHAVKDWVMHLLAIFEMTELSSSSLQMISITEVCWLLTLPSSC